MQPSSNNTSMTVLSILEHSENSLHSINCLWHKCKAVLNSWKALDEHAQAIHCMAPSYQDFYVCSWKQCTNQFPKKRKLYEHVLTSHLSRIELPCPFIVCCEPIRHNVMEAHLQSRHASDIISTMEDIDGLLRNCSRVPSACVLTILPPIPTGVHRADTILHPHLHARLHQPKVPEARRRSCQHSESPETGIEYEGLMSSILTSQVRYASSRTVEGWGLYTVWHTGTSRGLSTISPDVCLSRPVPLPSPQNPPVLGPSPVPEITGFPAFKLLYQEIIKTREEKEAEEEEDEESGLSSALRDIVTLAEEAPE